ncbi:MAG: hypothetical protein JXR97_07880 [Planctomycetes bacterium]|nr:hypothetical protein [Planctomycetota bacterium]
MNTLENVKEKFEAMGARLIVTPADQIRPRMRPRDYRVDIVQRRRHECYHLILGERALDLDFRVRDLRKSERHLVLQVLRRYSQEERETYLCGHDERHWFVAGVPNGIGQVNDAKQASKPKAVQEREQQLRLKGKKKHRRKNEAFIRQGEWFFVPDTRFDAGNLPVLWKEPIRRGRGSPHVVEFLCRAGGERVYVCRSYPNGISEKSYKELIERKPAMRSAGWRVMVRDAAVYARGCIRHKDHATVKLNGWHRVYVNGEIMPEPMAFLD